MNLIAFGKNTLNNLLKSNLVTFKKVIVNEDKRNEYKSFLFLFEKKKISFEILKREEFYRFVSDKKHQGIIGFLEDYKYFSLEELIERSSSKKTPLFVMLDSIEDPHNFGAIIRTCAAFDVDGIIILNKNQVPVNSTVLKVSTGGLSYVPVCRVNSLSEAVRILKLNKFLIISTVCKEELERDKVLKSELYSNRLCLVFGNEHSGVRNKVIRESNFLFSVPLENGMNSLNVSVSLGVIVSFFKKVL